MVKAFRQLWSLVSCPLVSHMSDDCPATNSRLLLIASQQAVMWCIFIHLAMLKLRAVCVYILIPLFPRTSTTSSYGIAGQCCARLNVIHNVHTSNCRRRVHGGERCLPIQINCGATPLFLPRQAFEVHQLVSEYLIALNPLVCFRCCMWNPQNMSQVLSSQRRQEIDST